MFKYCPWWTDWKLAMNFQKPQGIFHWKCRHRTDFDKIIYSLYSSIFLWLGSFSQYTWFCPHSDLCRCSFSIFNKLNQFRLFITLRSKCNIVFPHNSPLLKISDHFQWRDNFILFCFHIFREFVQLLSLSPSPSASAKDISFRYPLLKS